MSANGLMGLPIISLKHNFPMITLPKLENFCMNSSALLLFQVNLFRKLVKSFRVFFLTG